MTVNEIVGNSILVLMFSLAGAMIVNMFLGFGTTKTEVSREPPNSEQESELQEEDATLTLPKNNTEASSDLTSLQSAETEKEQDAESENGWRCACEGGFLPPGMLKSFGGAEAVMRLGTGQCYHKQGA